MRDRRLFRRKASSAGGDEDADPSFSWTARRTLPSLGPSTSWIPDLENRRREKEEEEDADEDDDGDDNVNRDWGDTHPIIRKTAGRSKELYVRDSERNKTKRTISGPFYTNSGKRIGILMKRGADSGVFYQA